MNKQGGFKESQMVAGQREARWGKVWLYLALAAAMFFAFFPIYWMFVTSIKPNADVFAFPPSFIPTSVTAVHYQNFFQNPDLLRFLLNSLTVATTTMFLSLIIASYAAYSFSKFRYTGRRSIMFLTLSAQMFPQALLLITLYLMFARLKLLDTYLVIVLPLPPSPFPCASGC